MKHILVTIFLVSCAHAEMITSKDFSFIANPPIKLELNTGEHEQGKVASFQGYDEKSDLGYIIIVNQNKGLAESFKKKPEILKEILEANHKAYTDTMKALALGRKQSLGKTLGIDSIAFEFVCTGYHPAGLKTYHNGIRLFHENAFYTIQVVSTKESTGRSKPLSDLISTFVLINQKKQ